jgi:hypothetical protein
MRFIAALGMAGLIAGCARQDSSPAADTAAPAGRSLASMAGIWDVKAMPPGNDSVLTTYVLNTTDTTGWLFAFPNGSPIAMRITGRSGDTLVTEAGPFDSSIRPGVKTRTTGRAWIEEGMMLGTIVAHYETTGPDSVRNFRIEGTRR